LTELNEATQQLSRTGSPYFDFLNEITLGPWSNKDTASLLDLASGRFNLDDLRFIREVAGEHPYLLQVLAFELWEAYEAGKEEPNQRREEAGYKLYYEAVRILDESWRLWSSETRQAFATIGLAHISSLMQREDFGKVVIQPNGLLYSEKGGVERRRLHQLFVRHFDTEELRAICFDLGEDYDSLPGEGKAGKARELIAYLERRGRISELAAVASEMRPDVCSDITTPLVHKEGSFAFQAVAPERLVRDFRPELSSLARRGFVREDTAVPGGWRVHPGAFLWWLADEVGTPEEGAAILIEAAARGVGEGVVKDVIGG